jgi:hypothetical protein
MVNTRQEIADVDRVGAKKMRAAFLISVLALVFVPPVRPADTSKDEAAVRDIIAQFDKAWNYRNYWLRCFPDANTRRMKSHTAGLLN